MPDVYVLAALGTSPAILTELCWALVTLEGHRVLGLEAWTTATPVDDPRRPSGESALGAALMKGAWTALERAVGPSVPCAPTATNLRAFPPPTPAEIAALASTSRTTWRVGFLGGDAPAWDVRTSDDADAFLAAVHDRVRDLRLHLPPGVGLVGCLAGGRKTMSAALQTAFSLQARPTDRLVHVLLHPDVEERVQKERLDWWFPTGPWPTAGGALAPAEQVVIYDVPIPPLRSFFAGHPNADRLDQGSYADVVATYRRLTDRPPPSAVLSRDPAGWREGRWWTLALDDGAEPDLRLPPKQGSILAVLALADGPIDLAELDQRLAELGLDRPDPERVNNLSGALTRLRKALAPLRNAGLAEFVPPASPRGVYLPARDRVTVRLD